MYLVLPCHGVHDPTNTGAIIEEIPSGKDKVERVVVLLDKGEVGRIDGELRGERWVVGIPDLIVGIDFGSSANALSPSHDENLKLWR